MSRRLITIGAALAASLLLTSCGTDGGDTTTADSPDGYPIVVENCGREVRVEQPIEDAVALNQGITEILLSMGLEDRIVGTATWTDPIRDNLAQANEGIPRLAENNASLETVLATDPDFVAASFHNTLDETGSGSFEQYAEFGIPAYLAHTECTKSNFDGDGGRDRKLTMDDIYTDIRELAKMFDVEDKGEELVSELTDRMTKASDVKAKDGVTAAFWFANSEAPYLAGGVGAPQIMADELGITNVFEDDDQEWPQISWEAIAAENPDILVIGDLTRESQTAETAKAKIEHLESNPVTREMDAVKNKRYVIVAGADMNPSIRTVDGVEKIAEALREFGLTA